MEKPKWFTGAWYADGDKVTNPFSGESYELNGAELILYDFIWVLKCSVTYPMK